MAEVHPGIGYREPYRKEEEEEVANVKKKRFEWIGHLIRTDHGRTIKILESKRRAVEEGEDQE
jgi:hypothetical protein